MQTPCSSSEDYSDVAKFGVLVTITFPFWIVFGALWLLSPIFWCVGRLTIETMTLGAVLSEKLFKIKL